MCVWYHPATAVVHDLNRPMITLFGKRMKGGNTHYSGRDASGAPGRRKNQGLIVLVPPADCRGTIIMASAGRKRRFDDSPRSFAERGESCCQSSTTISPGFMTSGRQFGAYFFKDSTNRSAFCASTGKVR